MTDSSWQPFTPATTTIPTARLTEWAGLLRQLSVHVPLEGPARDQTLEAAQLMQWWADHCMTPSGDTVQAPDVAALLRFAAAGRREYATNAPADQAAALESAAATFDQAARIASGDVNSLRFAVPSWRWDEADGLLGTDTAAPLTERPLADDPGLPLSALFDNRDPHQDEMRSGGDQ